MSTNLRNIVIIQVIAVIFAMLNLSSININYIADFLPLFDLMIIYYFAVLKPEVFAVWFLFLLGIISDSLNGLPLGITSFSYIVTVKIFLSLNQKMTVQENFHQVLIWFTYFIFVVLLLKWLIVSLYYSTFYNIIGPLIQLMVTCVMYVLVHRFLYYLDKKLLIGSD